MITLRRARERHHDRSRGRDAWLTFFSEGRSNDGGSSPLANGFGSLEILDEAWLPPGGSAGDHSSRDAQIVTFVRTGDLAWGDSLGHSGLIQAGEA
ncbi:MAG TPA: hypothetical protein VMT85_17180 [Thermoanaerobaculia bacterium]|nr:hypothetical protein [Thermoanaerobaculia bacterium]